MTGFRLFVDRTEISPAPPHSADLVTRHTPTRVRVPISESFSKPFTFPNHPPLWARGSLSLLKPPTSSRGKRCRSLTRAARGHTIDHIHRRHLQIRVSSLRHSIIQGLLDGDSELKSRSDTFRVVPWEDQDVVFRSCAQDTTGTTSKAGQLRCVQTRVVAQV